MSRPDHLTESEIRIVRLIARGQSHKQIAADLGLTLGTVKTEVSAILRKLHFRSRTDVAIWIARAVPSLSWPILVMALALACYGQTPVQKKAGALTCGAVRRPSPATVPTAANIQTYCYAGAPLVSNYSNLVLPGASTIVTHQWGAGCVGSWSGTVNYADNSIVAYSGAYYTALAASGPANGGAVVPGTDDTKWKPMATQPCDIVTWQFWPDSSGAISYQVVLNATTVQSGTLP